ncbi:hypothetical protein [Marinobacter sp. X15-166B]|uniref:hypothetical protein n=1 Tax=Marinobacter sp. X15-166B TaxID=1897620 RepID=UPI0013016F12|nr:hypothetical protein [Marinobacter sp. X15-166B]
MSTIERLTFNGNKRPIIGATKSRQLVSVELAGIETRTNAQRLADYVAKRTNMEQSA